MNRNIRFFGLGLVFAIAYSVHATDVGAQPIDWRSTVKAGKAAFQKEVFVVAETCFTTAMAAVEKLYPSGSEMAICCNNLAAVYKQQGKLDQAEKLFERALSIDERVSGKDSLAAANSLNNLSICCESLERYSKARSYAERALAIAEKFEKPVGVIASKALNNLSTIANATGEFQLAEQHARSALAIDEAIQRSDDIRVQVDLQNLAEICITLGKFEEAQSLLNRVITCQETNPDSSEGVAELYSNLGKLSLVKGASEDAETNFKKALEIFEETFGVNDLRVGKTLNHLALAYAAEGKTRLAEATYKRAHAVFKQVIKPSSYSASIVLNNLALLDTSVEGSERAIKTLENSSAYGGFNKAGYTIDNLATLYTSQGMFDEAEKLYQNALKLNEAMFGIESYETATTLNNLANLKTLQMKYVEAEQLYKKAIAMKRKTLGEQHPDVAICLKNYAVLLRRMKRLEEACELENKARKITLGPNRD